MKKQVDLVVAISNELLPGIGQIIEHAKQKTASFLNARTTLLYWTIGHYINHKLKDNNRTEYGSRILATLSQLLTLHYGKGFTYTALTRMCKVADTIDEQNVATPSQQLSWSHLIELVTISDELKREFYVNNQSKALNIKIKVQKTISETFKELAI